MPGARVNIGLACSLSREARFTRAAGQALLWSLAWVFDRGDRASGGDALHRSIRLFRFFKMMGRAAACPT